MKVTLVSFTQDADSLLIFSKKTRLNMSPAGLEDIKAMADEQKAEELRYVFGTIGSSWEFVDYVFLIEGVSRAFTHQLVRHRVGVSFAQQTMRSVDMSEGFEYIETGKCIGNKVYRDTMGLIKDQYAALVRQGVDIQDARGVLPTNIATNILAKFNLRSLSCLLNERLCFKAQGEFQDVAKELRAEVIKVHPWAEPVLQVNCVQYGVCKFPNFKECPLRTSGLVRDFDSGAIKKAWESIDLKVQPKGEKK